MINTQQESRFSLWQPFIYLVMLGFTFIAMPQNSSTYLLTRLVQAVEVAFCGVLFIQFFRQEITINPFNWRVNLWWFFYTVLAYMFSHSAVGLTPFFKWLNIIIFLLLGVCYWQHDITNSLKYMAIVFSLLIYVNAVLLVMFPEGLWIDYEWKGTGDATRHLFGNYNQIGFISLLGITIHAMYTLTTQRWRRNLFMLTAVSIWSVVFVGSMTSTVGLGMLTIYILIHNFIKRPRLLLTIFVIIYIAFFLVIVWAGNSIEEIDLMTRFIENVLSKDTTFTKRTDIWSNAIYKIQQSPWLGYGVQNTDWNITHLNASGPHNLLLMLLLQGGVVLCGAFIYLVGVVVRKALNAGTTIGVLAVVSICIFFTMSLFEAYNILQTFFLLQLAYYSSLLQPNTIESESTQSQIES
jgi:O-antigen ligase